MDQYGGQRKENATLELQTHLQVSPSTMTMLLRYVSPADIVLVTCSIDRLLDMGRWRDVKCHVEFDDQGEREKNKINEYDKKKRRKDKRKGRRREKLKKE